GGGGEAEVGAAVGLVGVLELDAVMEDGRWVGGITEVGVAVRVGEDAGWVVAVVLESSELRGEGVERVGCDDCARVGLVERGDDELMEAGTGELAADVLVAGGERRESPFEILLCAELLSGGEFAVVSEDRGKHAPGAAVGTAGPVDVGIDLVAGGEPGF